MTTKKMAVVCSVWHGTEDLKEGMEFVYEAKGKMERKWWNAMRETKGRKLRKDKKEYL